MSIGITPADIRAGVYSVSELAEFVDAMPDGCAYRREIGGERAWTVAEQLAVASEYHQRAANWLQTKDGSRGRNRPKPIPPPKGKYDEEREAQRQDAKETKLIDSLTAFQEWIAANEAARAEEEQEAPEASTTLATEA